MKLPPFLLCALLWHSSHQQEEGEFTHPIAIPAADEESVEDRMLNGEARPEGLPYQVALVALDHLGNVIRQCGGALIRDDYVLTSMQCLLITKRVDNSNVDLDVASVNVYIGGYFFAEGTPITTYPKDWIRYSYHPFRSQPVLKNDLALIHLPIKVPNAKPLRLPCKSKIHELNGRTARIAGWGASVALHGNNRDSWQQIQGKFLQSAPVNIQLSLCLNAGRFCGATNLHAGPSVGDNGSPLVIGQEIVGILSLPQNYVNFESSDEFEDEPTISEYTNVLEEEYLKWILEVTKIRC